jgi:hypothetical protein
LAHVSASYAERANLTLRCTLAMAASDTRQLSELADMVKVLEPW